MSGSWAAGVAASPSASWTASTRRGPALARRRMRHRRPSGAVLERWAPASLVGCGPLGGVPRGRPGAVRRSRRPGAIRASGCRGAAAARRVGRCRGVGPRAQLRVRPRGRGRGDGARPDARRTGGGVPVGLHGRHAAAGGVLGCRGRARSRCRTAARGREVRALDARLPRRPRQRCGGDLGVVGRREADRGPDAVFADFDDYWTPFLGGQGPAPSYAHVTDEACRARRCASACAPSRPSPPTARSRSRCGRGKRWHAPSATPRSSGSPSCGRRGIGVAGSPTGVRMPSTPASYYGAPLGHAALAVIAVGALVWTLTACSSPAPAASPTPTLSASAEPIFASDEEALAAAVAAYERYRSVSSEIASDGGAQPERISAVVSEQLADRYMEEFDALREGGLRTEGESRSLVRG